MGEPAYKLPEEDKPDFRPDLPQLRAMEGGSEGNGVPRGNLSSVPNEQPAPTEQSGSKAGLSATALSLGEATLDQFASKGGSAAPVAKLAKKALGAVTKNKKRAALGSGGAALVTIVVFFLTIALGPLQIFRLAALLGKSLEISDYSTSQRLPNFYRFYNNSNFIAETRVGLLGSGVVARQTAKLKAIGIELDINKNSGTLNSTTFDTVKMAEKYPELRSMNSEQQRIKFVSEKVLGLKPGEFNFAADRSGTRLTVVNERLGVGANRGFLKATFSITGKNTLNGKLINAVKFRSIGRFLGVPSWLHPFRRVTAVANTEIGNTIQDRQRARTMEEERASARTPPETSETTRARAIIEGEGGNVLKSVGSALIIYDVVCEIRDTADQVVIINRQAIAIPAALAAGQIISMKDQAKSLKDIGLHDLGSTVTSFTDKNGNSIWKSQPLQALADPVNTPGEDLPIEYKQAFLPSSTANIIKETAGAGEVGAFLCTDIARTITGAVGGLIFLSSLFDGGASAVAAGASKAAVTLAVTQIAGKYVATAGAMRLVKLIVIKAFTDGHIFPKKLEGALGGGLYAYGSQELAGMGGRTSGSIALNPVETVQLYRQQAERDKIAFQEKSVFGRMFDVKDSRSLASTAVAGIDTSPTRNLTSMLANIFSFRAFKPLLGLMSGSRASAATNTRYDFGVPFYGIPQSVADDPAFANPYGNAETLAKELDKELKNESSTKYIDRAAQCFGVAVTKGSGGWEAVAVKDVDPHSEDYERGKCDDLSDVNWKRMMLFVNDSRNMDAIACYDGEDAQSDQSCSNVGFSGAVVASASAGTTASGGDSSGTPCAAGTDGGIQDGYDNNVPYKIHICNVQGIEVNAQISANVDKLLTAAKAAGMNSISGSGFRTMAGQIQARKDNGCPDIYKAPSSACRVQTAPAGYSNHQMGLAIDFKLNGATICYPRPSKECSGNQLFDWLKTNAATYGLKNLASEAWHWSVDGK